MMEAGGDAAINSGLVLSFSCGRQHLEETGVKLWFSVVSM